MKKSLKITLLVIFNLMLALLIFIAWGLIVTQNVKLDKNLLANCSREIVYLDDNGNEILSEVNGVEFVPSNNIPTHVKNAFISIEDKRFYEHNGIDYKGLFRAMFNNLKTFSFKEGGSTISQQLIKNTHLSNEKTIKRKLIEFKLAKELEKNLTKDQILEAYLNTIYFGEGCYGISSASKYYFNKTPELLSVEEGAYLAGIIKAPSTYSSNKNLNKAINRTKLVLNKMAEQGHIKNNTISDFDITSLDFYNKSTNKHDFFSLVRKQVIPIIEKSPYLSKKLYVQTTLDSSIQGIIEKIYSNNKTKDNLTICIQNGLGEIKAYKSSCGDINRQPGSTLKPLAVYLPAIELGIVDSCTKIKDEKTDFNGYCPNNYGDNYNGDISVKQSLAKSSNVCAVKLLNMVGCNKSIEFLKKTDLGLNENDAVLSLALGATSYGVKATNLISSYNVFMNDGYYCSPSSIKQIRDGKGNKLYKYYPKIKQVFSTDSTEIVREMLKYTVENGTAKKLYKDGRCLYAKTGTVGNEKGNSDAYTISFNKEYVLGVWVGSKQNEYMENTITGGGLPCQVSNIIWENVYYKKNFPKEFEIVKAQKVLIDKLSYDEEGKVLKSDILSDENNSISELFTCKRMPKHTSTRFSSPSIKNIEITVNSKEIKVRLCVTEYVNYVIYNTEDGKKYKLYDSMLNKNKELVVLKNIKSNHAYNLSILPYFIKNENVYYGKEIVLDKIKTPTTSVGDDWWDNE